MAVALTPGPSLPLGRVAPVARRGRASRLGVEAPSPPQGAASTALLALAGGAAASASGRRTRQGRRAQAAPTWRSSASTEAARAGLHSALELESRLQSISLRAQEIRRRAEEASKAWKSSYRPLAARIATLKGEDVTLWEGRLSTIELSSKIHGEEFALRSLFRLTALPFLPEPAYRQFVRNVPGDAGFDPLNLAGRTPEEYMDLLEAEIKHGRLAMLAGAGIVAPEMLHRPLANAMGMPSLLAPGGCAPTPLNGQVASDPALAASCGAIFALIAVVEISQPRLQAPLPGYFGWDPLRFADLDLPKIRSNAPWVAEAEVKHGRLAMLAVTYMALRECYTQTPIWPPQIAQIPSAITSVAQAL